VELLALRQTPKMEDQSLSVIRDCLFNIFIPNYPPHLEALYSSRKERTRHFMATGTHFMNTEHPRQNV